MIAHLRKGFWITLLLLSASATLKAQDIIVTTEGESIRCRVIDQDSSQVVFMRHGERPTTQSEIIYSYRVHSIQRNVPEEMKWVKKDQRKWAKGKVNRMKGYRVGLSGGYSYLIADVEGPAYLSSYGQELKSGFNIKADAAYFFGRFFGLGIRYTLFHTENQIDDIPLFNTLTYQSGVGELSDVVNVHSIGLAPTFRAPIRKGKVHFLAGITAGYLHWTDDTTVLTPFSITTQAFYSSYWIGLDVQVLGRLYLGLTGELTLASSMELEVKDASNTRTLTRSSSNPHNMNRVDANLGLRYYL